MRRIAVVGGGNTIAMMLANNLVSDQIQEIPQVSSMSSIVGAMAALGAQHGIPDFASRPEIDRLGTYWSRFTKPVKGKKSASKKSRSNRRKKR